MRVLCPKCGLVLEGDEINVATDLAQCRVCKEVFTLSELVRADDGGRGVDLNHPPSGTWFEPSFDGFYVGGSTRSPVAFFLIPFVAVWSGFSLGGIYGMQIVHHKFDLYMSLFGIPFFLGSLLIGWAALMSILGKTGVRVRNGEGTVLTGVGPIVWRRRFDWNAVEAVREEQRYSNNSGGRPSTVITLQMPQRLRFGSGLRDFRREFVAEALRNALKSRGKPLQRPMVRR